jgi:hypothetical protein
MRVGITGSRYIDPTHYPTIDEVLFARVVGEADEVTTGGAVGVDTYCLRRLVPLMPRAHHRACIPEEGLGWDNEWLNLATEVERVPDTMNHPERSRNAAIIGHSDLLLAFPLHPEEHSQSKRSGTWMTIRMSLSANVPVVIRVLGH